MVDKQGGGISIAAVQINRRFVFFGRNRDKTNSNVKAKDPQSVEISFLSRRDFFQKKKETYAFCVVERRDTYVVICQWCCGESMVMPVKAIVKSMKSKNLALKIPLCP